MTGSGGALTKQVKTSKMISSIGLLADFRQKQRRKGMKKVLLAAMLLAASLAFGLDKEVAKRALDKEQTVAVKYQEQVVSNQGTIQSMNDEAKLRDFSRRLTYVRQQIYIRQFEFDKKSTTVDKRTELAGDIKTFTDQHGQLLHDFEVFVNGLK
jgi:hypothetical protein